MCICEWVCACVTKCLFFAVCVCVAPFGVVSSSREKIFYRLGMVCDSHTHSNIKASRAPVDVSQGWNQHGGVACCCVRVGGREIEACYFYSIANICSARVAFLGRVGFCELLFCVLCSVWKAHVSGPSVWFWRGVNSFFFIFFRGGVLWWNLWFFYQINPVDAWMVQKKVVTRSLKTFPLLFI